MADDAILDAGVDTDLELGNDQDITTELPDGGAPAVPAVEPKDGAPPLKMEPPVIDGKNLSKAAKETLAKIRVENPVLARQIQHALFEADSFKREVPGGLKEVTQLRETIERLGGDDGIQGLTGELDGWHQFDQQFTAGDPRALDFMTETPEGQAAFVKLAPIAFQKYAELHPEGYNSFMAKSFVATMNASRIPLALERLQDFITDPKAGTVLKQITDFVNGISEWAAKTPETKALGGKQSSDLDTRQQDLDQREATILRDDWKRSTAQGQLQVYTSEFSRLANGRKISDQQREGIQELFKSRMDKAVAAHKDKLDRYFQARDKAGFDRYAASISKTEIPKALRAAFDAIVPPGKPGPKPGGKPPVGGVPPKPAAGFDVIAQAPRAHEIDYSHPFNNAGNFLKGQAILKGGRKVQWKK